MSKSIKTGGVGKSPAIDKMNRLNEVSSRVHAAAALEKKAFNTQNEKAQAVLSRRRQIMTEFRVSFKRQERL